MGLLRGFMEPLRAVPAIGEPAGLLLLVDFGMLEHFHLLMFC